MALLRRRAPGPVLRSERLLLRPPEMDDYVAWSTLRRDSAAFLKPWEPTWARDHLTHRAFRERVYWAARAISDERAYPFFAFRRGGRRAGRRHHRRQHPPRPGDVRDGRLLARARR
jgi:RimJ/RimL family protein N-acetyltransferase